MMSSIRNHYDLESSILSSRYETDPNLIDIKFTPEEYYLYCGFSKDILNEFYSIQKRLLKDYIKPTLLTSFVNYLWGYMSKEDVSQSFNIPKKEFSNMFKNIIKSWNIYKNSENCDYLNIINSNTINVNKTNDSDLTHLVLYITCDVDSKKNQGVVYSEKFKKHCTKIHIYLSKGKIIYINNNDIECGKNINLNQFKSTQVYEILFDDSFEYNLRKIKMDSRLNHPLLDVLSHVSRFGVFNNNRNHADCLSIFEILFYLSKKFIESGSSF
ncbi:hypothetical protein DICPUDRAFT_99792 [Dictyostelium purpureum]|uniref:Uncharacterized protein n=1 Tax=Dictyostelium purpureum TaxID=5786 RepID=F1A2L2_DICPU|nr:uncharacterized protein DICPUDRAFT_99792 [Dictyostelium purpureum]EGC29572.1 hypothetical protein DICPUDRAFT_99792 [Dictyostelium purpureum]|eukprot:XP_003293904.1 hypothetical protein DICPUDRAFT_99792 [Dictyostelium purpureum]